MKKRIKIVELQKVLFYFLAIFLLFGCSTNIKMTQQELNKTVIDDPSTAIIINPSTGEFLGININNHAPPPPDIEAFPFCHCYLEQECRQERSCIVSYCVNCEGIDPTVPTKIICI